MSVLDRYLLRSLWTPLGGSLGVFLTLAIVVDLFEKLDTFLDNDVAAGLVTQYYVASVPFLFLLMLPVSTLIGALFSLGGMARRNELIAMTAAGVSLYRVLRPVLAAGVLVSVVGLAFTMELVPRGTFHANDIWDHEIKDRPRVSGDSRLDLHYLGAGGRFYLIRRFDGKRGHMDRVVVQQFAEGTLVRRIDAQVAEWKEDHWVFRDGYLREFRPDRPPHVEPFTERVFDELTERPKDFLRTVKDPDEMTLTELGEQIQRTSASGGDATQLTVDWHMRLSFPFASFIVVFLGAPLAGAIRRGGHALGFGLALLVGFVYYILLQIGETFGHNGTLPPVIAAWIPNVVFLGLGLWGLMKTPK